MILVELLLGCKFECNFNYFVKEVNFFYIDVIYDFDDLLIVYLFDDDFEKVFNEFYGLIKDVFEIDGDDNDIEIV